MALRVHTNRLCLLFITIGLLSSCASYNKQASGYYQYLKEGNYEQASAAIKKNKLLGKDRNRTLYLLERGKLAHLMGQWDSSNIYLNEADGRIESSGTSVKDIAVGTLVNPMMQSYQPEGFEKYLVHYYKALNYLQLGQPEEAMVEARRISLTNYQQQDKVKEGKYADDAFSLMLQGLIYERNGDINNAFIAYRNAADLYLDNNGSYYGTSMPEQLKKDLLRTADQNGFTDEFGRYQNKLNTSYEKTKGSDGGELILFWENGSAPVKTQQELNFGLFKDGGGSMFFRDAGGIYNVPYDLNNNYNRDDIKLEDLRSFKVALPRYEAQPVYYTNAFLQVNDSNYLLEPAENITALAISTLKERFAKELSSTLTRLAVKKLAETAARPSDKKDNSNKSEEDKKKQQKKDNQREALALGLQLFNYMSEKADTRNWQSLPHSISYARIPLQKGDNIVSLKLNGSQDNATTITINSKGGMYFKNICTMK